MRDGRRSDDVEINLWGVKLYGPVKALIALFSGTAVILALTGVLVYHTIENIRYNEKIILLVTEIKGSMNLQNGILILPQNERGAYAHLLPPETKKTLGMEETR